MHLTGLWFSSQLASTILCASIRELSIDFATHSTGLISKNGHFVKPPSWLLAQTPPGSYSPDISAPARVIEDFDKLITILSSCHKISHSDYILLTEYPSDGVQSKLLSFKNAK